MSQREWRWGGGGGGEVITKNDFQMGRLLDWGGGEGLIELLSYFKTQEYQSSRHPLVCLQELVLEVNGASIQYTTWSP